MGDLPCQRRSSPRRPCQTRPSARRPGPIPCPPRASARSAVLPHLDRGRIFTYLLGLSTRLGYGQEQLERLASSVQLSSLAGPAHALLSGIGGGVSLLLLIVTVVIFLGFDAASMRERLGVIRETHPHIAELMMD